MVYDLTILGYLANKIRYKSSDEWALIPIRWLLVNPRETYSHTLGVSDPEGHYASWAI